MQKSEEDVAMAAEDQSVEEGEEVEKKKKGPGFRDRKVNPNFK